LRSTPRHAKRDGAAGINAAIHVVGDVRLNVAQTGTGPAVLLLHGFPDSLRRWDAATTPWIACSTT
jgi:pimeloyl-ACP methyl ester carboxylesterase